MTLDLTNPAVSFLFFTGFGLWTFFVAWAFHDYISSGKELERSASFVVSVIFVSLTTGLIALFIVVTNALITP